MCENIIVCVAKDFAYRQILDRSLSQVQGSFIREKALPQIKKKLPF